VLACCAANGQYLPPFIVFKGKGVQARWTSEKSYPGTAGTLYTHVYPQKNAFPGYINVNEK